MANLDAKQRKQIHLVIPMSGQGTRFQNAGYKEPKPLIKINGEPQIARLLQRFPKHWKAHFILAENHRETALADVAAKAFPGAAIHFIAKHKQGPGFAIQHVLADIPEEDAVFVSYCDYGMIWDSVAFENFVHDTNCDSCVISYRGFHAHYTNPQMYAYCKTDGNRVSAIKEKACYTDNRENEHASNGGYYFGSRRVLEQALKHQVENEFVMNGESYTSLTVAALLDMKADADVRVFEIPYFFQWGTPADLESFAFWEKSYRNALHFSKEGMQVQQVLIPMAGFGSRFAKITDLPKPLIPVSGKPMYQNAAASLPKAERFSIVTTKEIMTHDLMTKEPKDYHTSLDATPEGQALSVEAGLGKLNTDQEVIVSACDHGVVLNPQIWSKFHQAPDCDAAIFVVKGYPGTKANPNSYAYVTTEDEEQTFSLVKSVSVKKPVSDDPPKDFLLVGTFWFRRVDILQAAIDSLKSKDIRVNNELYLDSVFELMIAAGQKVRIIPLDGYIGWGDPSSLAEALYWQEVFTNNMTDLRPRFPGVPPKGGAQ